MGSPISVVVAEIVMQHIEKRLQENPICQPQIWLRYVDDCLTILPEGNVQNFLGHLNCLNQNIQFTCEE